MRLDTRSPTLPVGVGKFEYTPSQCSPVAPNILRSDIPESN